MAGGEFVTAVLLRHRTSLLRELNDSNVLSILVKKRILSTDDEEYITNIPDIEKKCEFFIETVSKQGLSTFSEFCSVIEKECPCFVNEILNDKCLPSPQGVNLLETFKESMVIDCNINRESSSPQCRRSISRGGSITPVPTSRRCSMSPENIPPPLNHTIEVYTEPVVEDEDEGGGVSGGGIGSPGGGGLGGWETRRVSVSRVPGYGFGIAVSGGRDNPHFASGDPSIAVSDVLKAGPAEDLLQVNDRIMSVNGVSLENVEYATAVQVLRDSGNTVSLTVRRRAAPPTPAPAPAPTSLKVTLTKASKKEDFGIVLGCKLFIKELSPRAREQLNSAGQCLSEGDVLTRINSLACGDTMTLKEAKKIIDGCKERLSLVVLRESRAATNNSSGFHDQNFHNNYGSDALNSYSGQNLYVAPPSRSTLIGDSGGGPAAGGVGGGIGSGGRSRGPLPATHEPPASPHHHHPPRPPPPRPEDYYSSRRQLYEEDPLSQRNKPTSEPRLISFQKEGSVGLRLTGGNQAGIFVSAVQPGSPASLQGLTPGDNILKVNDMEMKGVTREEAVLFLLSLQEQIDLIVQHSPEEYQSISAQQRGDSFHIKCHFHYAEATKGEMSFRSGDVFHVVDTLHNGTVGAWQVYRIGRNNQEVQKGIIPNKARAEELATAQFNATKKELTTGNSESRGSFFRRRRSTHRRSKSLGKEHWDDMVFSDSISKFPAYERVVLKHPGFVRPVVLFGPIADLAREKLLRDYPEKFTSPQLDSTMDDGKAKSTSGIIRLSGIRAIMDRGKHALLDITPNAVDRLNYAQFYPIVVFLKADNKQIIKQLRQGIPKSAHKSSKKLLEQCQRMDRVWGHVFSQTVGLNEATATTWYTKLTDLVQRSQAQQLWISETKRFEMVSDIYFPPPLALYPSNPAMSYPQKYSFPYYSRHNQALSYPLHHKAKAYNRYSATPVYRPFRNNISPYYYNQASSIINQSCLTELNNRERYSSPQRNNNSLSNLFGDDNLYQAQPYRPHSVIESPIFRSMGRMPRRPSSVLPTLSDNETIIENRMCTVAGCHCNISAAPSNSRNAAPQSAVVVIEDRSKSEPPIADGEDILSDDDDDESDDNSAENNDNNNDLDTQDNNMTASVQNVSQIGGPVIEQYLGYV